MTSTTTEGNVLATRSFLIEDPGTLKLCSGLQKRLTTLYKVLCSSDTTQLKNMPEIVSKPGAIPWESTQAMFPVDNICDFHSQTMYI